VSALPLPVRPAGVRLVHELRAGEFPLYTHPEWSAAFPWLVQGTTGRGEEGLDMGLFGELPTGLVQARWRRLREVTGLPTAAHGWQVHAASLAWHEPLPPGLHVLDAFDGHATAAPGVLLTVSVADCVPVFLVAPRLRVVALLHGGWRGVAAGIVEAGVQLLATRTGCAAANLHLHCGPAICGACYEVGPEVGTGLALATSPPGKFQLDLRAAIAERAVDLGIQPQQVTLSAHCTRCGDGTFWSHRGGDRERQLAVVGIRP
jgi:YfiH family protein